MKTRDNFALGGMMVVWHEKVWRLSKLRGGVGTWVGAKGRVIDQIQRDKGGLRLIWDAAKPRYGHEWDN